MTRSHTDKEQLSSMFAFLHTYLKYIAQILLCHSKKKFVILYVYCNTIDRRGGEGGFRNGKQDNSSDRNEQFHRNSKESLLLYC